MTSSNPPTDTASASGPVVRCAVACPMCGVRGNQYRLNPRMFWYGAKEVDLQPSDFHCRQGMEGVHPPLYAMWHCAACHFTAEQPSFVAPLEGVLIRLDTVANRLDEQRRIDARFAAVITMLSEGLEASTPDFLHAIKVHLLAVWTWDLIGEMVKQDYLTQARYSLLLAWLYRDLPTLDEHRAQTAEGLTVLTEPLKTVWPEAPVTETAALRRAVAYYDATLTIANFTRDPVNEATTQQRLGRVQLKLGELTRAYDTLRRALATARRSATATRQRLAMDTAGSVQTSFAAGERARLVEQERRLLALADETERLVDNVRDLRQSQRKTG